MSFEIPLRLRLLALTLIFLPSSGCNGIGPRVETRFIIVHPGKPLEILSNTKVTGRRIDDDSVASQDIGGWIAMPREHFEALKRAIERTP